MLENGFIMLYRSLLKWEWYDDVTTKAVFLHLLLTVDYEDNTWHGITVKRGQRITSYRNLAEELHLSVQSVRTAINHLKSTHEVTWQGTREYSVVTVNHYEKYQTPTNLLADNQQTSHTTPTDIQQQRNKANKANKTNKANNTPKPPQGNDEAFQTFWNAYPKKVCKAQAVKAFHKINPDTVLLEQILRAIEAQSRTEQWSKDGGQFIPNPAAWLNGRRWEDEVKSKPYEREYEYLC